MGKWYCGLVFLFVGWSSVGTANIFSCPDTEIILVDTDMKTEYIKLVLRIEKRCRLKYKYSPCLKSVTIKLNKDGSTNTKATCGPTRAAEL